MKPNYLITCCSLAVQGVTVIDVKWHLHNAKFCHFRDKDMEQWNNTTEILTQVWTTSYNSTKM